MQSDYFASTCRIYYDVTITNVNRKLTYPNLNLLQEIQR
jgi:hypothetical protein